MVDVVRKYYEYKLLIGMKFLRRTRSIRRFLYSPLFIIGLLILFVVLLKAAYGAYQNEKKSRQELQNVRQNSEELSSREDFLATEIQRLESTRGLEEELRNKFPVAKEGEKVVIIVEPEKDTSVSASQQNKGFWSSFLDLFR